MIDISKNSAKLADWMQAHLQRYVASNGTDGHMWDSSARGGPGLVPTLILSTTGRTSGKPVILPLIYGPAGKGYVIIASKGGFPEHPAWYLNLVANPDVEIQVGDRQMRARARVATGAERAELWNAMARIFPAYNDYQKKTEREIPVVVLDPV